MKPLAESPSPAARDAEVNGAPPRIGPLAQSELGAEALAYCKELRVILGIPENEEVPEVTATMLRHPALNDAQTQMGIMLAAQGALSQRERELTVLRGAWITGAPFEWREHVDIAKRCGITGEEIERIVAGSSAPGWSRHEGAIIKAVEELFDRYQISDATWAVLAESWDERQLLEFPILVGVYAATAMQQNSIRARLRGGNTGLAHR